MHELLQELRLFKPTRNRSKWSVTVVSGDIQSVALRKLFMIEAAESVEDLREPTCNRLEMLKGDRRGWWSIMRNQQWRICFEWINGYAENIEIIDYH